jgi:integrase
MNHCLTAIGDIDVSDFGFDAARRLQKYLVDGPDRNAVSANSYLKMLGPVFELACREGALAENPLRLLRRLREPRKRVETYDAPEVGALLRACDRLRNPDSSRVWRTRIMLAVCAGLRRGEALNLGIGDIDFDRGEIWVCAKRQTSQTWAWSLKDHEDRKVPCPKALADHLARVIAELPEMRPYVSLTPRRYHGCQRLRVVGEWSEELSVLPDMNFSKPWQRICRAADVENKTFHGLRATCITFWLQAGVPVQEVRDLAGHSDVETTMRYYAAIRSDHVERASAATQKVIGSLIGATGLEPATS